MDTRTQATMEGAIASSVLGKKIGGGPIFEAKIITVPNLDVVLCPFYNSQQDDVCNGYDNSFFH